MDLWRRQFIALLSGMATWPFAVVAQHAGKVWRLGVLETISPALNAANFAALRHALRNLGYIEGQNLIIEYRSADGEVDRFPELAIELVRAQVDVIVTRGTPSVVAAKTATTTIPIVMAASGEPLTSGVIAGLARPGGNVTGLSAFTNELIPKRIELLNEAVSGLARIAFLQNMANTIAPSQWEELKAAALSLRIEPVLLDVRNSEDVMRKFDAARVQRIDALAVGNDTVTHANRSQIVELAAQHRLPVIYATREFVDAGGLLTYGVSYSDLYRRAATYVDKIFKGAKPADLPVEQPTKFELIINLRAAAAIGLEVPAKLLALADEVIE
jgi:putative tryptophan/tyrosine transport system substrate-binding protein